MQARQAVKARNLSRGFYSYNPSSKGGAFKGKGKSKGKPKGRGKTKSLAPPMPTTFAASEDPQGFLGAAVGDPSYTGCFICGDKTHDFRSCPKRSTARAGKGARGGHVHFVDAQVFHVNEVKVSEEHNEILAIEAIEAGPSSPEIFQTESEDPRLVPDSELAGYAVIDSGATETVASLPALEALMSLRSHLKGYAEPVVVTDVPAKRFKFGNGEHAFSSSFILLPQTVGEQAVRLGVFTMDVMGVPLLLGIKSLRRLKAVLDFDRCVAVFAAVDAGLAIHLKRSRSGHMLLDLKGDWLAEGTRLDNLPHQISELCFAEENLVEAAYVVQQVPEECRDEECSPHAVPEHPAECAPRSYAACSHCVAHEPHAESAPLLTAEPGEVEECDVLAVCPHDESPTTSAPKVDGPSASMKSLGAFLTLVAFHGVSGIQPEGRMSSHPSEGRARDQGEGTWQEKDEHGSTSRCASHGRPGQSRSAMQGAPMSWSPRSRSTGKRISFREQPTWMLGDMPEMQAQAILHSEGRSSCDVSEVGAIGQRCGGGPQGDPRERPGGGLPCEPRHLACRSRSVGTPTAREDPSDAQGSGAQDQEQGCGSQGEIPGARSIDVLKSFVPGNYSDRGHSGSRTPGTQGHPCERDLDREPGVREPRMNEPETLYHVTFENAAEIESLAQLLIRDEKYDYASAENFIMCLHPRTKTPSRASMQGNDPGSFSVTFGLYAHGNMSGLTRATSLYPATCQYLNGCLKQWRPDSSTRWTSFSLSLNTKAQLHIDAHNQAESMNMTCTLGRFEGGELWLECEENEMEPPGRVVWESKPNGTRTPGHLYSTWRRPLLFSPKRYHRTRAWKGDRIALTAFTARSLRGLDPADRALLRKSGFPVPGEPKPILNETSLHLEEIDFQSEIEVNLTEEDYEAILQPLTDAIDGLDEIFLTYPSVTHRDVLHVCDPWTQAEQLEPAMICAGVETSYAGFKENCDLGTHAGFLQAQRIAQEARYRWMIVHVPRGPQELFPDDAAGEPRPAQRARRYLRLVRHLLLLSQMALQHGTQVVWLMHPTSQVLALSEVRHFWKVHGHGKPFSWTEGVKVIATSEMIRNTLSTTTSGVRMTEGQDRVRNDLMSRNTVSTTTSGVLDDALWHQLGRCLSVRQDAVHWSGDEEIHAIDTSVLQTLTTQELQKLMDSVRQLHRRFGHPSNRLLIKNLQARGADPKVIVAASQLRCDECLEGRIKLPSPAVNLDRCDRLWACLQVDGFDFKYKDQYHHFVLMVDEASGYAVVREAYSTPEDVGRNLTTQELMDILEEAWYQYFGLPEQLKLDLEGAHRGKLLRESCMQRGIELIAAPAEHHESISEVERSIGILRGKMENFLRASPTSPRQAALAMVAAHNSLAKVHGFSPLQWALGRDWSPGLRLQDGPQDEVSASHHSTPWSSQQVRLEAEKAFLESRHREAATRAKNMKIRQVTQFLPGDLVFYRRYRHPADLVANQAVDHPRMKIARWFGPARVLACETKVDGNQRKPSAYVWAVSGGRLKKFHMSQLRHASEQERLVAEATSIASLPWTFTSLQKLMGKGTYDDESLPPRRPWGNLRKPKRSRDPRRLPPASRVDVEPKHVRDAKSDEEMVPDEVDSHRKRGRAPVGEESEDDPLDIDRLLHDVEYLPPGQPLLPSRAAQSDFQQRRAANEQQERPWHVQHGVNLVKESQDDGLQSVTLGGDTLLSVVIDVPPDPQSWKKILRNPGKFLAKSVQKGVEVSYHKLDETQRRAMDEAKAAEVQAWVASKVAKAAQAQISSDAALKMRWVYTFKAVTDDPTKIKAKARIVVLGFSDPSLLERETSSPALTRTSKMLLLNYAVARRWRIMAGDVRTAFLQAKSQDRVHPLYARPLPELAEAFGLTTGQMIELLGSAYGLTSAPREWYMDLSATLRSLGAEVCATDPCLWRLIAKDGSVVGVLGIHVDDILLAGDEAHSEWVEFVHRLHGSYQWAPWETDQFTHCGLGLRQLYDDSVMINHEEYCSNISQIEPRRKGDEEFLREDELSQLRAVHGAIQWRVTQSAPHHAAKLSYLQSFLATKDYKAIDLTNKLIREVHASRHLSVGVHQLDAPAESLVMVGWSDAAVANRPDGASTGGHIYGFMRPEDVENGYGKVNVIGWKSGRLQRVARSSLAAETQALADMEQEIMFARLTWAELLGNRVNLEQTVPAIKKIPAVLITDARALFDALEKGSIASSGYSMKDKYTALEMQALSQHVTEQGSVLQWVDSDHQLADGLTKIQKQDVLKKFLAQGTWRLRLDGALLSAKKRRALHHLGSTADATTDPLR